MSTNPNLEAGAQRIVEAMIAAWNAHDPAAFSAPFARDADFTNVFGMRVHGRSAVEGFHRPVFRTMFKDSVLVAGAVRCRAIRPDVGAVDLEWTMTGALDPQGDPWPERRGLINMILTRDDGEWFVAVLHNMDLPPKEKAEAQARLGSGD